MFEAHELRRMLHALDGKVTVEVDAKNKKGKPIKKQKTLKADPALKAMVLVAANCSFGQSDIVNLPKSALDLDSGRIDFPRPKTGVRRRCPLWPETVEAVRASIEIRPAPKNSDDDPCCSSAWRTSCTPGKDGPRHRLSISSAAPAAYGRRFGEFVHGPGEPLPTTA